MTPERLRMIFFAGIAMIVWGTYKTSHTLYSAITWETTEGTVVDFVLHNFKCGKQSQCFSLNVGYHVNDNFYMVESDKTYNRDRPKHLSGKTVEVLYSPDDPAQARLTGEYGPGNHGIIFFFLGALFIVVYVFSKRE